MPSKMQLANAIRFLSIDAVNRANSGHPGAPMGMADMAVALWQDHLRHNPQNPDWVNRDRFVLSNGHASMMQYAVLHLTGYDVTIDDIKQFRQLHSKTPGHPENFETPGVETTTGPLGQGLAMAVGMALSEKMLAAQFNQPAYPIVDHHTYVFLGDGCLMEGVSHEVCALAGTYRLNKLIALYDDNGISIDGPVAPWFSEDVPKRFEAYGWQVIRDIDGHDAEAVSAAIAQAKKADKPTLICCKTQIGYGSPKAGSESAHGSPLGEDNRDVTAKALDWPHKPFVVPDAIYAAWNAHAFGESAEQAWQDLFARYAQAYPALASEFSRRMAGALPTEFAEKTEEFIAALQAESTDVATRKASEMALDFFAGLLPEMVGGSADLTGSNNTKHQHSTLFSDENPAGNYFSYGVREFGMAAILNGMANHGGVIPYAGTFLVFSDYARNAMRLSALMKHRVIYVMTHDSIGLGEDGPTHQPVEHLASLRVMPNMHVWRPCDAVETAVAWQCALENQHGPATLALSRQGLPKIARDEMQLANIDKGGYVIRQGSDLTLVATGSEVGLAMQTAAQLATKGIAAQVVSMPCYERYRLQDKPYQDATIMADKPRIVIEAGATLMWEGLVAGNGFVIGIDSYGASAPAKDLFAYFGFDADMISAQIETFLS
ncbi:transketolase [Ostreibacterium oceani]|uniref:Transketolase n=1 Tax=Ostreibacterium oceani TaxID=2654998 RepID=A0A6N7EZ75_9GAMM|nr:transketolase [Ostreibacterium oceani]MPV86669.1 transketolase [Ostreibacterium oceani]